MPKLTVDGRTVEVPHGKRLVNALRTEAEIDQLHACGGKAKCTTCRVRFISGNPEKMTEAEKNLLTQRELIDQPEIRLSCQILCERDMEVEAISRLQGSGRADAGSPTADEIEPPPVWTTR